MPYHDSFQAMVDQLAERIVALVEESPLDPSAVPDIDEVRSAFLPDAYLAVFAVAVIAPPARTVPVGGDPSYYGESSPHWRPFSRQELSVAEAVKRVAERLAFKVAVTGIEKLGDPLDSGPGIMLIDPWFVAADQGLRALQSIVRNLPQWVLPLLVLSSPRDMRAGQLTQQVMNILSAAGAGRTESARRAASGVSSVEDFLSIVPVLVVDAERQYLRHGPVPPFSGRLGTRLRLGGAARPDSPTSSPHLVGEAPGA